MSTPYQYCTSFYCKVFITFEGTPAAKLYGGTSCVTTALAPIIHPYPIVTPGIIQAFSPIQTLFPIVTGPFEINFLSKYGIFDLLSSPWA